MVNSLICSFNNGALKIVVMTNRQKTTPRRPRNAFPALGLLPVGEPDANAESVIAQREQKSPLYLEGFVEPPLFRMGDFEAGTKFLILGQKGTGKTAILRNIENRLNRRGFVTEYIVFRDTLLEAGELENIPFEFVVNKDRMRSSTFYHHCLKRIFISTFLKVIQKSNQKFEPEEPKINDSYTGRITDFIQKIMNSDTGQVVSLVIDSAFQDVAEARTLLKLDRNPSEQEITRLLKRLNDRLLDSLVKAVKKTPVKAAVFVDEVHFRYKDENSIRDDAVLVRDTILSIIALNERFVTERIDCAIFVGIRSEYLSHPVIAAAEVGAKIQSYGESLGWETMPANAQHPLFDLAQKRISAGLMQIGLSAEDAGDGSVAIVRQLFQNVDKAEFIQSTWSKPRDMVRFLKQATRLFGNNHSLSWEQYHAVMRAVARDSWDELRSALSSFLSEKAILDLEAYIRQHASISLEHGRFVSFTEFLESLKPIYDVGVDKSSNITINHFVDLLYMLGVFITSRKMPNGSVIRHSFHRGQPAPDHSADVALHFLVAKCFS